MSGSCPGDIALRVEEASPGGRVALVYGTSTGPSEVPAPYPCAGIDLNLGGPGLGHRVLQADGGGIVSVQLRVPADRCGRIRVQALDLERCIASNPVEIQ